MESVIYIHQYRVIERLGKGGFSTVFKAEHRTNRRTVAIKVEPEHISIKHESQILAYLRREMPEYSRHCFPVLHWYGIYGGNICLAMSFYSKSLKSFIQNRELIDQIGICHQIISAFCWIHETGVIHCDVKPDNFMVDDRGRVVVIDFGLASLYIEDDEHRPNILTEHLVGSPKYASYFIHQGNRVSRRDDLISIGYLIMWIFGVEMEWNNIQIESGLPVYDIRHPANIQRAICKKPERLIANLNNAPVYSQYMVPYFEYVYNLEHDDDPDYNEYLRIYSTLF